MSILNVNKINPVGGGSTITIAGIASVTSSVTAPSFVGSGANLTSLPAANLTGSLPAISAANLTNIPAANLTGTLPAISGANLTGISGGKILQVVQSVKTNTQSFSTGSSTLADSYFDISGLSVSITPASGTKCFVSYTVNVGGQSGYGQGLALFRDSTQIYLGNADGSTIRLSNFDYTVDNKKIDTMAGQFLDTHGANGSTAVTYKLQMYVASPGWTSRVNRSQTTSSDRYYGRCASSITVMEVAS